MDIKENWIVKFINNFMSNQENWILKAVGMICITWLLCTVIHSCSDTNRYTSISSDGEILDKKTGTVFDWYNEYLYKFGHTGKRVK